MSTNFPFDVKVIDGEGLPVSSVEVGVRYKYESGPRTWSAEYTDGDGLASFRDDHPSTPIHVAFFVDDEDCGDFDVTEGGHVTIEM